MGEELLGENLKQRFVLDRRDGAFALGAVVAEARALAAGDEKGANLAFAQQAPAAELGVAIKLAVLCAGLARIRFYGLDVLRKIDLRFAFDVRFDQLADRV